MAAKTLRDITEQPFPHEPANTGYCVFPPDLENDSLVLFHATPAENVESIVREGFRIPDSTGKNGLPSVTFAKRSSMALDHAVRMRAEKPGSYVILAVRYETLKRKGIKENIDDIHDYTLDPQPEIIRSCPMPTSYQHV